MRETQRYIERDREIDRETRQADIQRGRHTERERKIRGIGFYRTQKILHPPPGREPCTENYFIK